MIRLGVFAGSGGSAKPEPVIIETQGVILDPELTAKIATSHQVKNESKKDNQP